MVAAQDDPAATTNAQRHFSQRRREGQNSLPQDPCWGAEHVGARGWVEDGLQGLTVLEGQVVSLPHPELAVQLDHQAAAPAVQGDAAFFHRLLQHRQ